MNPSSVAIETLAILQWPRVGPVTVRKILAQRADDTSLEELASRAAPHVSASDRRLAMSRAEAIIEECSREQILLIAPGDPTYPTLLKQIIDFPPLLYMKGDPAALERPCVAIVGTRKASETGARLAHLLAEHASRKGLTVVSGLALGIDAAAHRGALDAVGRTIAVMAHGLDTVAPRTHANLAASILESNGALVSEHPPGVPPRPPEFVRRNRIQSGMSLASIVVESGATGGAMHQAGFTVKQHRRLFTVLASSEATRGDFMNEGALRLISEFAATPLRTPREFDEALDLLRSSSPPPLPPQIPPRQGELL